MTNIPSDDDFSRAKKLARKRSRGLDKVCENVTQHFRKLCPLHNVYVLPQRDVDFRAYVFFKKDKDIQTCEKNGIAEDIIDFVYAELERAGRGKRGEITVAFDFDSDQNVTINFEADYFLRLR